MTFYTYMWLREDGTPYYVGKTVGGKPLSARHRENISKTLRGRKFSEQVCRNMRKTPESRRKMSIAKKKMSVETRRKISQAVLNISDTTREKMSAAAKRRWAQAQAAHPFHLKWATVNDVE